MPIKKYFIRIKKWYRDHTLLSKTTARKEIIAKNHLENLIQDPRYAYSCGVIFEKNSGKFISTGNFF